MSFYEDWKNCIENNDNDLDYREAFLKKKDFTRRVLKNGNNKQIECFCKLLIYYDIQRLIDTIDDSFYNQLTPSMIMQYSNLQHGTSKLIEVLYNKDGLSYPDIGKTLVGSSELYAATKYGENHSKLAREFDLVSITSHKPSFVRITSFGKCFAFFDTAEQIELIKKLTLRDPLIQNLIIKGKKGIVYYYDECSCLSDSTKIRRRRNVRRLFELIFQGIDNSIINNVIW